MSEYIDASPRPTYCSDSSSVSHQDARVSQMPNTKSSGGEDDQIYYGFGVFIGLPLSELKAMKEEFMQKNALKSGTTGSNSSHESVNSDVSFTVDQEPQYISCDGQHSPDSSRREASDIFSDGQHVRQPIQQDEASVSRHDDTESDIGHETTQGAKPHSLNFILH